MNKEIHNILSNIYEDEGTSYEGFFIADEDSNQNDLNSFCEGELVVLLSSKDGLSMDWCVTPAPFELSDEDRALMPECINW